MKITLDVPDSILALHIVAVTRANWPNIALYNCSVPSGKLVEGAEISITAVCEPPKEEQNG